MTPESDHSPSFFTGTAEYQKFLTVQEIARLLKLNPQTVRNWIGRGALPALRIGRRVRILRVDFERFLEDSRVEPNADAVADRCDR